MVADTMQEADALQEMSVRGSLRAVSQVGKISHIYPPALIVTVFTVGMVGLGLESTGFGRSLFPIVSEGWARLLGPVILGFIAAVLLLEQVQPAVRRPVLARGHVQDLVYFALYATVVVPLIVVIDLGFSQGIRHLAPWLTVPKLNLVPRLAVLAVAVLLMDGFNWLAHWANHRWVPFWRFHAVHHSQEELTVLTSFRAHPLVHTSFLISIVPVVVLSSNAVIPATAITVYICLSSLPHANLPWTFGPLGKLFVSPAYHRLHHASEGRIDVNLGTVLTIWDVLTDRAVFPKPGSRPIRTGLDRRQVPVEQSRPTPEPLGVLGVQLAEPFLASRAAPSAIGSHPENSHAAVLRSRRSEQMTQRLVEGRSSR
jgi:sterol desaturase/sphingolipid hydroxylase (fatty acid hydroxylase superfamily)